MQGVNNTVKYENYVFSVVFKPVDGSDIPLIIGQEQPDPANPEQVLPEEALPLTDPEVYSNVLTIVKAAGNGPLLKRVKRWGGRHSSEFLKMSVAA